MNQKLFAVFILTATPFCAVAEPVPGPEVGGVWAGTLGHQAITACFNDPTYGNYYYQKYLSPIHIITLDKFPSSQWIEGDSDKVLATWQLHATSPADPSTLDGAWTDSKKTLPIHLHRIAVAGGDTGACADDAYNKPLITEPKVVPGPIVNEGVHRYRMLHLEMAGTAFGPQRFELLDAKPGVQTINIQLDKEFPKRLADLKQDLDTRLRELGTVGVPATDSYEYEVVFWNAHWITLRYYVWTAGMGANGIDWWYRTWNTDTGQEVHPWDWFGKNAKEDDGDPVFRKSNVAAPRGSLRKRLFPKGAPTWGDQMRIYLGADGVHFDNTNGPDGDDTLIPYAQVGRYMSADGQGLLSSLRAP